MDIGSWDGSSDTPDARFSACKMWTAALTADEMAAEMRAIHPVRFADLFGWYPMFGMTGEQGRDYSGNGYDFATTGTLTAEDGPPVSWGSPVWIVPFVTAAGGETIEPDAAISVAGTVAPTVILGAITITPSAAIAPATAIAPTVLAGGIAIEPGAAVAPATAVAPTVVLGAVVVAPSAAIAPATAVAPIVLYGATTAQPGAAIAGADAFAPSVIIGVVAALITLRSRRRFGLSAVVSQFGLTVKRGD